MSPPPSWAASCAGRPSCWSRPPGCSGWSVARTPEPSGLLLRRLLRLLGRPGLLGPGRRRAALVGLLLSRARGEGVAALGRQLRGVGVHAGAELSLDRGLLAEAIDVVLAQLGHPEARGREVPGALLGQLLLVIGQTGTDVVLDVLAQLLDVGVAGLLPGHLHLGRGLVLGPGGAPAGQHPYGDDALQGRTWTRGRQWA